MKKVKYTLALTVVVDEDHHDFARDEYDTDALKRDFYETFRPDGRSILGSNIVIDRIEE